MENLENNKLIAEFMGYNAYEYRGHTMFIFADDNHRTDVDLHYHTSWDWLMPVVQKCYKIEDEERFDNLVDAVATLDMYSTYNAVVEFIKQQNKNN
jgi:hypothetical protein